MKALPCPSCGTAKIVENALGPEESVLYDHTDSSYIYGAPIGDVSDPNHPKDKDGGFIRKRYKSLGPQKKDYTIGKAPSTFARNQDFLYRCACQPKLAKSLRLTRAQFVALPDVQA